MVLKDAVKQVVETLECRLSLEREVVFSSVTVNVSWKSERIRVELRKEKSGNSINSQRMSEN